MLIKAAMTTLPKLMRCLASHRFGKPARCVQPCPIYLATWNSRGAPCVLLLPLPALTRSLPCPHGKAAKRAATNEASETLAHTGGDATLSSRQPPRVSSAPSCKPRPRKNAKTGRSNACGAKRGQLRCWQLLQELPCETIAVLRDRHPGTQRPSLQMHHGPLGGGGVGGSACKRRN